MGVVHSYHYYPSFSPNATASYTSKIDINYWRTFTSHRPEAPLWIFPIRIVCRGILYPRTKFRSVATSSSTPYTSPLGPTFAPSHPAPVSSAPAPATTSVPAPIAVTTTTSASSTPPTSTPQPSTPNLVHSFHERQHDIYEEMPGRRRGKIRAMRSICISSISSICCGIIILELGCRCL